MKCAKLIVRITNHDEASGGYREGKNVIKDGGGSYQVCPNNNNDSGNH
jgi:hypothetical protein